MGLEYQRIHNDLVARALAGPFHPVTIDPLTKLATVDTNTNIVPATAMANEISAGFGPNPHDKRTYTDHRTRWEWELILSFDQYVTCERFEQTLTESPVRLVGSLATGNRYIYLHLRRAEYVQPLQQQLSTGTKATYKIEASLSPI